jgi:hypothetical protein
MGRLAIAREQDHNFYFIYQIDANNKLRIVINCLEDGMKSWEFQLFHDHYAPIILFLKANQLDAPFDNLENIVDLKEIMEHFRLFMSELKKHPSYRLKLIPLLMNELREIWNNV